MDRQARKLQIQREQQGYYEGSATAMLNPDDSTDGSPVIGGAASGGTASASGGLNSSGNRMSDLTILSDDDEKEVSWIKLCSINTKNESNI